MTRKDEEATQEPSPCQHEAKRGHDSDWNAIELAVGEVASAVTVHHIYRIALRQFSQITPKIAW